MTAAETPHLAAKLNVPCDLLVRENSKAVNNRRRLTNSSNNPVGIQIEILLMTNRKDYGRGPPEGGGEVLLDADLRQGGLVREEARPGLPLGRVGFLALQLVPVVQIGIVDPQVRSSLV